MKQRQQYYGVNINILIYAHSRNETYKIQSLCIDEKMLAAFVEMFTNNSKVESWHSQLFLELDIFACKFPLTSNIIKE